MRYRLELGTILPTPFSSDKSIGKWFPNMFPTQFTKKEEISRYSTVLNIAHKSQVEVVLLM